MNYSPCVYAPDEATNCIDLGCSRHGGRRVYLGGRRMVGLCACRAVVPSHNVVLREILAIETVLERYREFVASKQPIDSDVALLSRLERFRNGEEMAWREISASYLKPVLELVESLPVRPRGLVLMDTVQEANVGLGDAIHSFTGTTRDEFWIHAHFTILAWLNTIDDE